MALQQKDPAKRTVLLGRKTNQQNGLPSSKATVFAHIFHPAHWYLDPYHFGQPRPVTTRKHLRFPPNPLAS
jgi:hypothetical protein